MHKLDKARHAGNIQRYHGWPTVQQQTNAHHTWNVMRIYIELFGIPSRPVTMYMMYHDVGELDTGDISFVVKRSNPEVKKIIDPIEDAAMDRLSDGLAAKGMLIPEEECKVKICDLMEMLEFSLDEMRLGSRHYGWMIFENIYNALIDLIGVNKLAVPKVNNLMNCMWNEAVELKK